MTDNNTPAEIGRALWVLDFMVDYIADTGSNFCDGQGGDDESHQVWSDAIYENRLLLRDALTGLKKALLQLPPEMAGDIAKAFHKENEASKARGAANAMLADIQRQISQQKGGAS